MKTYIFFPKTTVNIDVNCQNSSVADKGKWADCFRQQKKHFKGITPVDTRKKEKPIL